MKQAPVLVVNKLVLQVEIAISQHVDFSALEMFTALPMHKVMYRIMFYNTCLPALSISTAFCGSSKPGKLNTGTTFCLKAVWPARSHRGTGRGAGCSPSPPSDCYVWCHRIKIL